MSTMYERIDSLCKERGTNVTAMCKELGIARSSLSELNSGRSKTLSAEKTAKIAAFLGTTVDYLLGNEPKENAPATNRSVSDDDIMFALFNGSDGITDEMYEEVKRFAQFIKERESGSGKR